MNKTEHNKATDSSSSELWQLNDAMKQFHDDIDGEDAFKDVLALLSDASNAETPVQEPDSTVLEPDSRVLDSAPTVLDSDSSVLDLDSTVLEPDSTVLDSDSAVLEPDSTVLDSDSSSAEVDETTDASAAYFLEAENPGVKAIQPLKEAMKQPRPIESNYQFIEKLGKGSQGQVWLAERRSDGEKVAIKQLNIHSVTTWKQYELFRREADTLASLNMPGIATFYEYIEDLESKPPYVCIIQKYIEGKTLADMLQDKHRFEAETIYDIIAQTLAILQNLHEHKPQVIHRDIKPSNIMLTPMQNGRFAVTLLDFGAVANPQVQNGGSTVAGTFGYMPPEQLMGQALPGSDIYALAAVAVQMLSGISPADIDVCDFKLVIEPHLTHVPPQVVQTLSAMLEPALTNRFCDHSALIAQFADLADRKKASFLNILKKAAVPKLEDVKSICQPGNYEIWQAYEPGKTPFELNKFISEDESQNGVLDIINQKLQIINLLVIMAAVFGFLWALFSMSIAAIGAAVIGGAGAIAIYSGWKREKNIQALVAEIDEPLSYDDKVKKNLKPMKELLAHGQKLVGKITHIEYVSVEPRNVREISTANDTLKGVRGIPLFIVTYRFHVQYSENNIALNAEFITSVPPENHYKIGDPITLLALISADEFSAQISVMPYPYPFGKMVIGDVPLNQMTINMWVLTLKDQTQRINKALELANASQNLGDNKAADNFSLQAICLGSHHEMKTMGDLLMMRTIKNYEQAEYWYKRAFQQGNLQAGHELVSTLIRELKNIEANQYLESLFCMGDNEAAVRLANYYQQISKYEIAEIWFRKALKRGYRKAGYELALMYENKNEMTNAIEIYEYLYQIGEAVAAVNIGNIYRTGKVKNMLKHAEVWYEKALAIGGKELALSIAENLRKELKSAYGGVRREKTEIIEYWYEHAHKLGEKNALEKIGDMYAELSMMMLAIDRYTKAAEYDESVIIKLTEMCIKNRYSMDNVIDDYIRRGKEQYIQKILMYLIEKQDYWSFSNILNKLNGANCKELLSFMANGNVIPDNIERDNLTRNLINTLCNMKKGVYASNLYKNMLKDAKNENENILNMDCALQLVYACEEEGATEEALYWFNQIMDSYSLNIKDMKFDCAFKLAENCRKINMLEKAKLCYERAFVQVNLPNPAEIAKIYVENKDVPWLINICEYSFADGYVLVSKLLAAIHRVEQHERHMVQVWENIHPIHDRYPQVLTKICQHYMQRRDWQNASKWAQKAYEKGDKKAGEKLFEIHAMNPTQTHKADMLEWYKNANNIHEAEAACQIGDYYKRRNMKTLAIEWYTISFENGSSEAGEKILKLYALEMRDETNTIKWYNKIMGHDSNAKIKSFEEIRKELARIIII